MRQVVLIVSLLMVTTAGCFAQNEKKHVQQPACINQPKANIKINKEYDKNGNLIRYDSTYTYSFSSKDTVITDDFFKEFQTNFSPMFSYSARPFFSDFFVNDSSMTRYNVYRQKMNKLYKEIDSLRNAFILEQFNKNKKR